MGDDHYQVNRSKDNVTRAILIFVVGASGIPTLVKASIQTYATVMKHHGPCTCEIVHYHSNSNIESGQNVSYETLMARLSLNISWNICPVR